MINFHFSAIVFLTGITGVSVIIGFGSTLAAVRKTDQNPSTRE